MSGLTSGDLEVLKSYASQGNRELYFNYLAQKEGNDGYGLLALGVVRNDNAPGAVANAFAAARARQEGVAMSPRSWDGLGVRLIRADVVFREAQFRLDRPDLALNLPVQNVQDAHDLAFEAYGISPEAWTPRQLLDAARRHGDAPEAEQAWGMMLDNKAWGLARGAGTLGQLAERYASDPAFPAADYGLAMAAARVSALASAGSNVTPDRIEIDGRTFDYSAQSGSWRGSAPIESRITVRVPVDDPVLLEQLNDRRDLRLHREQLRGQFHPDDPNRDKPIVASPWLLSDAAPAQDSSRHPTAQRAAEPTLPDHPRHALYQQCAAGVRTIDASLGRDWDGHSECMAASLTALAARSGLERVDHVLLSQSTPALAAGANVFVVQGDPANPAHLRAHMPTQDAVSQTPADSFQQLVISDQRQQALEQAQTEQQDQQQATSRHVMG